MPVASELLIRIDAAWKGSDALRRAKTDTDAAKTSTEKARRSVLELGTAYASIGVAVAAAGVAAKAAFDFAEQGAQIQQLETSFERMNREVFKTPDLLNQMRDASGGTIGNLDAMSGLMTLVAGTSKELAADLAQQSPKLLEIAKAATTLNPTLGDTASLYNDLASGIKRGSTEILDNLGIVVKQGDAQAAYAAQVGKTVEALTGEEKIRALLNAAVEKGNILIEQAGGSAASATDSYSSLNTELTLLKEEAAKAASEGLTPLVAGMADALRASREFREGIDADFAQGLELASSIEDLEVMADKMRLLSRVDTKKAAEQMDEIALAVARASSDALDFERNLAQVLGTAGGIRTAGRDWREFFREFEKSEGIRKQQEALEDTAQTAQENAARLREVASAAAEVADGLSTVTRFTEENTRSTYEATQAYAGWANAAQEMHQARLDKIAEDTKAKEEADRAAAKAAEDHKRAMEAQAAAQRELNAASGDYFTAADPSGIQDLAQARYEAADAAGASARVLAELAVQEGILTQAEADAKVAASDLALARKAAAEQLAQTGDVDAYTAALEKAEQAAKNFQGVIEEQRQARIAAQTAIFDQEDPNYRVGDTTSQFSELETAGTAALANVQTAAQEAFTSLGESGATAFTSIGDSATGANERFAETVDVLDSVIAKIKEIPDKIKTAIEVAVNVTGNAPAGADIDIGAPAASAGYQ